MYRGAYGVLQLKPWEFHRLLPGEYCDLMLCRMWVEQQKSGPRELKGPARQAELAKFDALMAERRARGEHR